MQGTESDFSDGVDDVQFVFAVNNSVTKTPNVETRICDTNVMLLVSVKSKAVLQMDTLYSCLLSLLFLSCSIWSLTHTPIIVYIYMLHSN